MNRRFIVFDVETPNARNNRISSIGICAAEGGRIVDTFTSLVNPETHFDRFNVMLTGITPEMVRSAPNFGELWRTIGSMMESGILIAHNAPFDMRVLADCIDRYEIDFPRYVTYGCTVRMGRKAYPDMENHKLNTMCGELGIPLDHHKADSDCLACARLLLNYMERGLDIDRFLRTYDMWERKTI